MLYFFSLINCLYIYHKFTGKFLGMEKRPGQNRYLIVPVAREEAIDFKIKQGGIDVTKEIDPLTQKEKPDKPQSQHVRISHPTKELSWDATSIERDGNKLLLSSTHNGYQQLMNLNLLGDLSFAISWKSKCFIYNEKEKHFETGECENLKKSSFILSKENNKINKFI